MAYQSITGAQTTPSSGGYKSIAQVPHTVALNKTLSVAKNQEQQQLKQHFTPDPAKVAQTQRLAQQSDAQVAKNTTGSFLKNLKIAGPKGVAGAAGSAVGQQLQGLARTAIGTPLATIEGKTLTPNRAGNVVFGKAPIQTIQQQGEGTAASHPGGFHIKGTPLTLSPTQTGLAEAGLSGLNTIGTYFGAKKGSIGTLKEPKEVQPLTGKPSNSIVAPSLPKPGLETNLSPSLTKTRLPTGADKSTKYVLPSHLNNLDDSSIATDYNKVKEISQATKPAFTKDVHEATGIQPSVRIKSQPSFEGKVERYNIEGKHPSTISDNIGARLTVDHPSKVDDVIKGINDHPNLNVQETRNYFKQPSEWGYRGVNMKVKLPNDTLAEVQVHTPQSLKVSSAQHDLYEKWRNVDYNKLTPQQIVEKNADMLKSRAIGDSIDHSPALPEKSPDLANSSVKPKSPEISAGKGSVQNTNLKPKLNLGEEGSVAPGQAISDVKDMLQKHQESSRFSGDLEKNAVQSEGSKKVIQQDTAKLIKGRQELSNADKQTLQNFRDSKAAGLKPEPLPTHLQAEDLATTELNKATQAHDAELARLNGQEQKAQTIEARNPETYTHREAQGKGTALDYVAQGTRKNPLSVSGLSKSTPSSKARVFHAITDEQGNRRVVAIKNSVLKDEKGNKIAQGKLVQTIGEGKSENLGKLKLTTDEVRMQKELEPIQKQIDNIEKEKKVLANVKAKGGVSKARVVGLNRKAAEAFNKLGEDVGRVERRRAGRSLSQATMKADELGKVKAPYTNAPGRLETLNKKLLDAHREYADVLNKYDVNDLDNKTFIGKDGKKYTIGQAMQSEITKATGQKYYVDPKLLAAKNYAESRTALENARFIQSIKDHPDFDKFASEPGHTAPKGWETVSGLDQFRGYKFEPKTAEVLTDLVKHNSGSKLGSKLSNFLRNTIVYFPLKHTLNEGVTYAVDRGLSSLVNPMAYKRGAESLVEAFHEVTNQGPKFQAAQKAGLHTVTGGDKALSEAFSKEIKNLAGNEKTINDVAKQWGSTPKRIYNAVQELTVWQLQDMLNMARVIERTKPTLLGKGASLEDAVTKTQRYNLQYSVPSRVGPKILPGAIRRDASSLLRSKAVFFGRYKYDLYRILSNTIKDTVNLKSLAKGGKENARALDKLAALALGTAVVWPLVDKGIQKVSGNKNAYMKAPGALELPSEVKKVATGKEKAASAASNQLFVSSAVTLPLDLKSNRDSFTGKQIYDPNASGKDQLKQALNWSKSQLAPAQQVTQVNSGKNKVVDTLLTLASARLPKNSPETNNLNSLKFDSLPNVQANAKQMAKDGNINGAIDAIKAYDNQVLEATRKALLAGGQSVPDDKTLEAKLKQQGYFYNPTRATVQGWASPSAKVGTLQDILNANPAPKKGQPGYFQYKAQQKQKSFMSRFKKPADKQTVIP